MALGIEDEAGMYDDLFDFDQDGKLNIFEKSAEMDYFAEQVENMNPQSKQLCDEIWEALGGSFDQKGNPIRVNEAQLELSYEFEKNENIRDDIHRNDDATEIDPDNISVSPEVIKQIYEMAIRGELPSDNG